MLDAVGNPQTVLVLGGGSEIASATVRRLGTSQRLRRVVLAGRLDPTGEGESSVEAAAARLRAAGQEGVSVIDFDAAAPASHPGALDPVFDAGDVDVVLFAAGVLPDADTVDDPAAASAVAATNFSGPVSALTVCANRLRGQGHGVLVVLSSVSAARPRRSTYLYGATKAGLDAFATGLGDALHGSGVTVLVVRPGFVRTTMTRGLPPAPFAVEAPVVAEAIAAALAGPSRTIWVPGVMRVVMASLRLVPRPIFRRLPI